MELRRRIHQVGENMDFNSWPAKGVTNGISWERGFFPKRGVVFKDRENSIDQLIFEGVDNISVSWDEFVEICSSFLFLPACRVPTLVNIHNCHGTYKNKFLMEVSPKQFILWSKCVYCGNKELSKYGVCSTCGAPPSLI